MGKRIKVNTTSNRPPDQDGLYRVQLKRITIHNPDGDLKKAQPLDGIEVEVEITLKIFVDGLYTQNRLMIPGYAFNRWLLDARLIPLGRDDWFSREIDTDDLIDKFFHMYVYRGKVVRMLPDSGEDLLTFVYEPPQERLHYID